MKRVVTLFLTAVLLLAWQVPAGAAGVELTIPVTAKVKLRVPGRYHFRYALFDATDPATGVEVWAEQMDVAGPRLLLRRKSLPHQLGALTPGGLAGVDFSEQLFLEVQRFKGGLWVPCSARLKLSVVPYAMWSATTSAGLSGAITGEMLADGAVTADKIGIVCGDGDILVYTFAAGWHCSSATVCSPGDFLNCYSGDAGTRGVGICRPGTRECSPDGTGFEACVGEITPGTEVCNDLDDDCNGEVDDDATDAATWYADTDLDSYGDPGNVALLCWEPDGGPEAAYVKNALDCDDTAATTHPGAFELCDGKDNDCDGDVDEDCGLPPACSAEEQQALAECGFACLEQGEFVSPECMDSLTPFLECVYNNPPCFAALDICINALCSDDWNAAFLPGQADCQFGETRPCGATEVGACAFGEEGCFEGRWDGVCVGSIGPTFELCSDGADNDCDGQTDEVAPFEICNGIDDNCNGVVDENCFSPAACGETALPLFQECLDGCGGDPVCAEGCYQEPPVPAEGLDTCFEALQNLSQCVGGSACDPSDLGCVQGACGAQWEAAFVRQDAVCTHGTTRVCGLTNTGVCEFGTNLCDLGQWGLGCAGAVYPEPELCEDGLDNDCDGQVDELSTWWPDEDGDEFGSLYGSYQDCSAPEGYVETSGDCDDGNPEVFPEAPEICDGFDNDCNGVVDDGVQEAPLWYFDNDQDGYAGDLEPPVASCDAPGDGYYGDATDCDDTDPDLNLDDADLDGWTSCGGDCDDGDPALNLDDADSDGWTSCAGDCDDGQPTAFPSHPEVCDGVDNDCNDLVDDNAQDASLWYLDNDQDGYAGNLVPPVEACEPPGGWYSGSSDDCDDTDPALNLDDLDLDGWTTCDGDCDDGEPWMHPQNTEFCDGLDNDCNGVPDDGIVCP